MRCAAVLSRAVWLVLIVPELARAGVVIQAAASCPVAGIYDQRCIDAALRAAKSQPGSTVQLGCHTYTFQATVVASNLSDVEIAGAGSCTTLTYAATGFQGATLLSVNHSQAVSVHDLSIVAPVVPRLVTASSLPATGPFQSTTVVAIDRGFGHPYVPTVNDQDIVPVELGGQCRAHCISKAQLGATVDLEFLVADSTDINLYRLTGSFATLTLQHVQTAVVRDSSFTGGGKRNSWGIIAVVPGSGPNTGITIIGNTVKQSAFSGISVRNAQGVVLDHNISTYNGESGFKIGQGPGNYVLRLTSTANESDYNHYDGFDYSEDVYSGKAITFQPCNCTSTDDLAAYNQGTGFITNGADFTYTRPVAHDNQDAAMDTVLDQSVIQGGVFTDNNTGHHPANQISIDQPDAPRRGSLQFVENTITVTKQGVPGYGIYVTDGRYDSLHGNTVRGAKIWDASHNTLETQDVDEDGPHNHKPTAAKMSVLRGRIPSASGCLRYVVLP